MAADWEDTFHRWSGPASDTEADKRDRTERAVREAIQDSTDLTGLQVRVFAKGSYKNSTNVRLDSDVDVAVEFQDVMFHEATDQVAGMSQADLGLSPYSGTYQPEWFKDDVERALISRFGSSPVDRGNKALHVRENKSSLSADVVPCFTYHQYYAFGSGFGPLYNQGILIHPDSGARIENWPEQNYQYGKTKNEATGRRYKRVIRILKRLENDMVENGVIAEIPSFLLECLVYNVPNEDFQHPNYQEDVRYVLIHLYNGMLEGGGAEKWVEVNGLKWLFSPTQRWSKTQAHDFVSRAWDYLGFE